MKTVAQIPLFNPRQELELCGDRLIAAVQTTLLSGTYVNGPRVQRLEEQLAARLGIPWAVGVASGTMALELMLRAVGIGPGIKVMTSAHTFVAVVEAILQVGAEPSFVDIDPRLWQMPAGNWEEDAVLVSHLYGGASPAIHSRARWLLEDASQSFGATLHRRPLGTLSTAAAVSLYPTKNLAAVGDGGVVLTADTAVAERLRALRNHGQVAHQEHLFQGTTGRLDEIQATILEMKLMVFDQLLAARRQAAIRYRSALADLPVTLPELLPGVDEAPNLFVVSTPYRDALRAFLAQRDVMTGIHYPTPIHRMPAYRSFPWAQVDLPHTTRLSKESLTLPLWAGIGEAEQDQVVEGIKRFFHEHVSTTRATNG